MTALQELSSLLPPEWPREDNTSSSWWEKYGGKIKVEDHLAQAELDLFYGRDPGKTGSAHATTHLETLDVASDNHKLARDTCLLLRDDNPKPMLSRLQADLEHFMGKEQYARYIRFWARDCFLGLLYLSRRTSLPTPAHEGLRRVIESWLGCCLYWLAGCSFQGQPYPCGLRREGPEELDSVLLRILCGLKVDTSIRAMGHSAGSIMNGGMPRATGEWFGIECRAKGLLAAVRPRKPAETWPTVTDKSTGVLTYFPRLKGRPGGGPILVACEMRPKWTEPKLWLVMDSHSRGEHRPGNVYLAQPPSENWGFDPDRREIVSL